MLDDMEREVDKLCMAGTVNACNCSKAPFLLATHTLEEGNLNSYFTLVSSMLAGGQQGETMKAAEVFEQMEEAVGIIGPELKQKFNGIVQVVS